MNNHVLFFGSRSQCIIQINELKEQCEDRIEDITRKGNEIPQSKEKNMSDKHYQVNCVERVTVIQIVGDLSLPFRMLYQNHPCV